MNEAKEIKERLAKYKIVVPTRSLFNSLITPDWQKERRNNTCDISKINYDDLPEPGYGLSINPFKKVADKKNKKKRH